jgi:DNA-binding transcriptional regulator GbsR (MarR family)
MFYPIVKTLNNYISNIFESLKIKLYIWCMEFKEAKNKFVQTWGALGSQWGINKTMAQIHALLMIAPEPLSMEDIMEELQISRGNASMNLRALMDWGIVYKEFKQGERREFFTAEKDLDELAVKIAQERSKREIKPALKVLKEVSTGVKEDKSVEAKHFTDQTAKLYDFVLKADNMLEKATEYKDNWLAGLVMKLMR